MIEPNGVLQVSITLWDGLQAAKQMISSNGSPESELEFPSPVNLGNEMVEKSYHGGFWYSIGPSIPSPSNVFRD